MKKQIVAGFVALVMSGSALAFHCPADMAKIDAALAADPQRTEEQLAEVQALRTEGERLHEAGEHQKSVDTLAQAMTILGLD